MNRDKKIDKGNEFRTTDMNKADQIASNSPYKNNTSHPQTDASYQSADNDMDRKARQMESNQKSDADEAQSDGNLSFPEGK